MWSCHLYIALGVLDLSPNWPWCQRVVNSHSSDTSCCSLFSSMVYWATGWKISLFSQCCLFSLLSKMIKKVFQKWFLIMLCAPKNHKTLTEKWRGGSLTIKRCFYNFPNCLKTFRLNVVSVKDGSNQINSLSQYGLWCQWQRSFEEIWYEIGGGKLTFFGDPINLIRI